MPPNFGAKRFPKGRTTTIPGLQKFNVIVFGDRLAASTATAKHLGPQARPLANVSASAHAIHGTVSVENRDVLDAWFDASVENRKRNGGTPSPGDLLWFHKP